MKKTLCIILLVLTVSILHAQDDISTANEPKKLPIGLYFDVTIPPIIKQIFNDTPFPFAGGVTYMDFGLGVSFFNIKAQINYGFMYEAQWVALGGDNKTGMRYGGNVLGLRILTGLDINFGDIFDSNWDWISASIYLGWAFSRFDATQFGKPAWIPTALIQLEFPKFNFPNRKYLRSFSIYTEFQLWYTPSDLPRNYDIDMYVPMLALGVRAYIF